MNSSQPSAGGGGIMVIIVIVLLIAIGVGGYFGYTKWWVPKQCVGQDATSNVSTFMYDSDSGTCMANVCMTGFGCDSKGTLCTTGDVCASYSPSAKYIEFQGSSSLSGNCNSTSTDPTGGTTPGSASSQVACENTCTGSCTGYDWNATTSQCSILSTALAAPTVADSGYKCYKPPS
jgi:hypothetical protein